MTNHQRPSLVIEGGTPLFGSVRLGGAKNASYKLMIAALLGNEESRLLNLPDIADVRMVKEIINNLGGEAYYRGERALFINPKGLKNFSLDNKYGEASRASTLFLPPLLAKFKKVVVPLPGGDKIGKRPLERHFEGLQQMGVFLKQENGLLYAETNGLKAINYRFTKNTHTGTETLIMAAVLAQGKTILENAALEPEVDDLISFLNNMGARIRRRSLKIIEIEGVSSLSGAIHRVMPDRNEAVSYACAALATKGDIIIENARYQDLEAFLDKVAEVGGGFEVGNYGIRFYYQGPLRATDIETSIHPGFMTDWQPLFATVLCHAAGESIIYETVMQSRFQYVETLSQMGAKMTMFNPDVSNPEKVYNFNIVDQNKDDFHALKITGPTQFIGGEFVVHDLRAGATSMLAAISGKGVTTLHNVGQIDRGYEELDKKLISMGAKIKRLD